jgi:CRISPR/Cas system-associated endonuclease Cas1
MNIAEEFKNITVKMLINISVNENKDFNNKKANKFFMENYKSKFTEILETAKKDAKDADIMGNLDENKIDPLVNKAGQISIQQGLSKFAKEIFDYSKIK